MSRRTAFDKIDMIYRVAFEFQSKDALDEYLKLHPKADPKKHWVKDPSGKKKPTVETKSVETKPAEQKTSGKLYIPPITSQHNLQGDLSNIKSWKVPIMLGNSVGKGQKKGDLDNVGYVAIGLDTDEMIPIARGDEHRAGYELLFHLQEKNKIKGKKFITLYSHSNYMSYLDATPDEITTVCKKWRDNGGNNALMINNEYATDFDDVVESKGNVPSKYEAGEISKPLKRQFDLMQKIKDADMTSELQKKLVPAMSKKLAVEMYNSERCFGYSNDTFVKHIKALAEGDADMCKETIFGKYGVITNMKKESEGSFHGRYFGDKDAVKKAFDSVGGEGNKQPESPEELQSKIKPKAQNTIKLFEDVANDYSNNRYNGIIQKSKSLSEHLWDNADSLGVDKNVLSKLDVAIQDDDSDKVVQMLYSFDGIKNKIHNRLRQNVKDKKEDEWFGDSQQALDEFNRLSQI